MSKREEMIVRIDKDGNTTVEFNNFAGQSCEVEDSKVRLLLGVLGVKADVTFSEVKPVEEQDITTHPNQIKNKTDGGN